MNSRRQFVGVDGTPDGWVAVQYGEDGFADVVRYDEMAALWDDNAGAETILVDVPIGLAAAAAAREPEQEARRVLEGRTGSVFNVPIREVVDEEDYHEANRRQKDRIGKGLMQQTFNITPKIRAVDDLLNGGSDATQETIRESHPEVCFWAFNDAEPMQFSKTGQPAAAFWERVAVLETVDDDFTDALAAAGKTIAGWDDPELSNDDLLDAFVLALTATVGTETGYETLPAEPETDEEGLRMEMVYAEPPSQN
ncbi:DUF429 domain-containing protein [Haloarchaeobius amylolyticus]|uniref:DUF429 domain-containing protein n=1 Tax=Haloarchaeobius amylolyticus TaxID=1198296 RepID=UPI00226DF3C0|nr:DUF429 domain-containing protein [Haloarchaeobius amylolyticus]